MAGRGNGERDNALQDAGLDLIRAPYSFVYGVKSTDVAAYPGGAEEFADRVPWKNPDVVAPVTEEDVAKIADKPGSTLALENAKTRVYLSGPMSGIEDFNFPAFEAAAEWLRSRGYPVFSPAEQGWGNGDPADGTLSEKEYLEFMREDIAAVSRSDMIVLLEGWETSRGANFELSVARRLKLEVRYLIADKLGGFQLLTYNPREPEPETVLQEADRLVSTDRAGVYGHPFDDFSKVTGMALALWGRGPETPEEHALYMVLVKLARLQSTPGHHDSIVDVAGYMKTYDMVIQERIARISS